MMNHRPENAIFGLINPKINRNGWIGWRFMMLFIFNRYKKGYDV